MPILFTQEVGPNLRFGVWRITEDEDYFTQRSRGASAAITNFKGRRRLEWLASRHLVRMLVPGLGEEIVITKDAFGKPFLGGADDLHMSISHTRQYAAAIVGPMKVGIDIQVPVSKITRIAHKFLSEKELDYGNPLSIEALHIYWGAKESMYKIYGRRQVDFRSDLEVSAIAAHRNRLIGRIRKSDFDKEIDLGYKVTEEYVLVYASVAEA